MLRSVQIGRAWLVGLFLLLGGCDDRSPSVRLCERWADNVRGTLREDPSNIAFMAKIRGHCTMAEDHIISGCAFLAPDDRRDRAVGFTEAYEEACRAGRTAGIRDADASPEQRAEAWQETLDRVSAAFDGVVGTLE